MILHVQELKESAKMVIVYVRMVSKILMMTVTVKKVGKLQILKKLCYVIFSSFLPSVVVFSIFPFSFLKQDLKSPN